MVEDESEESVPVLWVLRADQKGSSLSVRRFRGGRLAELYRRRDDD